MADAGAPEGEAKDKTRPVEWREGWNIAPDLVLQLPDPYKIPATGTLATCTWSCPPIPARHLGESRRDSRARAPWCIT